MLPSPRVSQRHGLGAFHSIVRYNEFLVRYLENIGVEPTRANIEYVKKQVHRRYRGYRGSNRRTEPSCVAQTPLDGCKMTAAYKSRGALNDIIYITPKNRRQAMSNNVRKIGALRPRHYVPRWRPAAA